MLSLRGVHLRRIVEALQVYYKSWHVSLNLGNVPPPPLVSICCIAELPVRRRYIAFRPPFKNWYGAKIPGSEYFWAYGVFLTLPGPPPDP